MLVQIDFDKFEEAKFVVDPSGHGTHRTITEALCSASDGDVIAIKTGIYKEDIEIKCNVKLAPVDMDNEEVTIVGEIQAHAPSTCILFGLKIITKNIFCCGSGEVIFLYCFIECPMDEAVIKIRH